jgi:hypothetical protein
LLWFDRAGEAQVGDLLGETVGLDLWRALEMIGAEVFEVVPIGWTGIGVT